MPHKPLLSHHKRHTKGTAKRSYTQENWLVIVMTLDASDPLNTDINEPTESFCSNSPCKGRKILRALTAFQRLQHVG